MQKRTERNFENKRLVDIDGFMAYTSLGRNKAAEMGESIGCRVKVGKRILYDLRKTDQYFDRLTGVK